MAFPSGTTISCYGTDSDCSGTPNDINLDYADDGVFIATPAALNPCCFTLNPFTHLTGNYYTALGSRCQSCSGKQLFKETCVMVSYITETLFSYTLSFSYSVVIYVRSSVTEILFC